MLITGLVFRIAENARAIIWDIWRGDYELVETNYNRILSDLMQQKKIAIPPPDSTLFKLINTAIATMNVAKEDFTQIETYFKEIESEIIPQMEEAIKEQFE